MFKPNGTFATEFKQDVHIATILWRPDGSEASTITIDKEIWMNTDGRGNGLGDGIRYPVFLLYNYLDPSTAHSSLSGCLTHPSDEPYTDCDRCMAAAERFERQAIASGKWVPIEQVKKML